MRLAELVSAELELDEALGHYAKINPRLVTDLLNEVTRAKGFIREFPLASASIGRTLKRCNLQRFPYALVNRVADKEILIVAYAHHKRRPDYWRERLRNPR